MTAAASPALLVADLIGVAVFAASGARAAVAKRLDLFGVVFVGFVAALGGGILRDLVIDAVPPLAFADWRYAVTAVIASVAVFWLHPAARPAAPDRAGAGRGRPGPVHRHRHAQGARRRRAAGRRLPDRHAHRRSAAAWPATCSPARSRWCCAARSTRWPRWAARSRGHRADRARAAPAPVPLRWSAAAAGRSAVPAARAAPPLVGAGRRCRDREPCGARRYAGCRLAAGSLRGAFADRGREAVVAVVRRGDRRSVSPPPAGPGDLPAAAGLAAQGAGGVPAPPQPTTSWRSRRPGAGKTTFALRIAAELLADGTVEAVTVVAPDRAPEDPVGGGRGPGRHPARPAFRNADVHSSPRLPRRGA